MKKKITTITIFNESHELGKALSKKRYRDVNFSRLIEDLIDEEQNRIENSTRDSNLV